MTNRSGSAATERHGGVEQGVAAAAPHGTESAGGAWNRKLRAVVVLTLLFHNAYRRK